MTESHGAGWSKERNREYEELVDEFQEEGRYEGREEEVAARIINKQRAEHGETQEAKQEDREGKSPDRNLPINNYDRLDVDEITPKLDDLSKAELRQVKRYEEDHNSRKTLLEQIDRKLDD